MTRLWLYAKCETTKTTKKHYISDKYETQGTILLGTSNFILWLNLLQWCLQSLIRTGCFEDANQMSWKSIALNPLLRY